MSYLLAVAHGGGWGYSNSSVEAIRFSPDTDIILGGLGLYGGRGQYNAEIKVKIEYSTVVPLFQDTLTWNSYKDTPENPPKLHFFQLYT